MENQSSWQNSTPTVYVVTAVFFMLSLWGIMSHELWLDEAHHYLLARDSISVKDLLNNVRYEGHPIAWNLMLYGMTRFTTNPIWMQVLHIGIMTLAVSVYLKKAPFPIVFKLLFIFGYFMFYEYNILSRNYNLGILFVFLACSLYQERTTKFVAIAMLLGLACHSHAIFLILASSIMAMISLERLIIDENYSSIKTWLGIVIFGLLALISVLQILPPSDTSFFDQGKSISFLQKIPKSISPFFKSIFLIPDVTTTSFWNTNVLINYSRPLAGIFAIASLVMPYLLFYNNKKLVFYMYFGIFFTGIFFYITSLNAARYYGILYLFLITALWFDAYAISNDTSTDSKGRRVMKAKKAIRPFLENVLKKLKSNIVYTILVLHFVIGIYAFLMDINTPFTTAKQTAQYLKDTNHVEKIIATKACNGTALSAYIRKPVFFTRTNSYESYCTFNRSTLLLEKQENAQLFQTIKNLLKSTTTSIIFVTYEPLFDATQNKVWILQNEGLEIVFLKQFDGSIIKKGNHYIYEIFKN